MSRFYAGILGQGKTEVTRIGSKKSGIRGHIRGWDVGIWINAYVDENGNDSFGVLLTGGSNRPGYVKVIGTFTTADLERQNES